MRKNLRLQSMAVVALLLCSSAATADEPDERARAEARTHFRNGARLIRKGAYDEALAEFNEAYRLYPNERIHYDIAQAYRLKHDNQQAVAHYRRYLAAVREGEIADDARQQLSGLGAAVAEPAAAEAETTVERTSLQASASIGSMPSPTPEPREVPSEPGTTAPTPAIPRPVVPRPSTPPQQALPWRPLPEASPPRASTPPHEKWWVWTLSGTVVLGVGLGLGLGLGLQPHAPAPTIGKVTL